MSENPVFNLEVWQKAVDFHGHACPGLAIGVRMAQAALQEFLNENTTLENLTARRSISPDEELVCVTETDACCIDAVQSLLGCSLGKGNLLLKLHGKTAASFYYRPDKKAVRILWTKDYSQMDGMSREEKTRYILSAPLDDLFIIRSIPFDPPSRAVVAQSFECAACGEKTAEYAVRLKDGQPYCLACWPTPARVL